MGFESGFSGDHHPWTGWSVKVAGTWFGVCDLPSALWGTESGYADPAIRSALDTGQRALDTDQQRPHRCLYQALGPPAAGSARVSPR